MIPVKLALRNFMPYRDNVPPLYFNDIHTASIWGGNGHGKSSLMDAITWALWGRTRAKSDDDIIHLGENETEVEFDFTMADTLYRVIRKHALPKRKRASGQSMLDFQISSGNGSFRSIAGNTIAQTQQQIIDVLHMDYPTFINSAYLRQGHADEFTQQPPVKRKEVLSNILGLSRYDRLEEQSREHARQKEAEKNTARNIIDEIGEELTRKPEYETELERIQAESAGLDKQLQEKEKELSDLRQKKELLDSKRQQVEQTERYMAESIRTKDLLENRLTQLNTRIEEYNALIGRREAIEDGYRRLTETRKVNEELDRKFRMVSSLNDRKHKLEIDIMRAGQTVEGERALIENTISRLTETFSRLDLLKTELLKTEEELKGFDEKENYLSAKKQELKDLQSELANLEVTGNRIKQEVAEITEKLDLLSSQTEAKCPLCERELGEEHRILIVNKYTEEKRQKSELLEKTRQEYAVKSKAGKTMDAEIAGFEKNLVQEKTSVQNRINLANRDIQEVEKAGTQLEEERTRLVLVQKRIDVRDYAPEEQNQLAEIARELATVSYDAAQHEKVRGELESLLQYEEPKRKLDEALKNIDADKNEVLKAGEHISSLVSGIEEARKKNEQLESDLASLPALGEALTAAETENRQLSGLQKQAQESVGRFKALLQRAAELEERAKEKEKQLEQAAREEQIYRELARAFGKRGIQMWLIETAIPEIELEANRLLERMTDNRMHVKIETQRETRRGTTLETLDINISDELGTRNYEMFSGGEAFRIDFAIRIALSKLLARRAGAPLPTLIIDEGFGTQDVNGLEKLKEAIISIQDDFKKILVVTHIEEFRDAFPTRIDIVKTTGGSTIRVS
ncbi:MAG: SMC family ATPase [Dehalococcoidales bacterium]|nr:SMC family ATPase [Dehalococcoidales bacterium]